MQTWNLTRSGSRLRLDLPGQEDASRRRWAALAALCASQLMVIGRQHRRGVRRLRAGPSIVMLCATRFVQGIGAAMASAVVLSMIITLFRRAGDRGRALALYGFVGAAGSSIGLLAGGVISRTLSWPWIFLINAPLGLAAILAVRWTVPRTAPAGRRPDVAGALLATGGLMLAVYALVATSLSWPEELLLGVAALIWLSLFLARQTRVVNPLLPLRLLASRSTGLANLVQALMVAGLSGSSSPVSSICSASCHRRRGSSAAITPSP